MIMHPQIKKSISTHGQLVLGTPDFAYSIGRSSIGQPDLIVCTGSIRTNHYLLNMVHLHLIATDGKLGITTELIKSNQGQPWPVEIILLERNDELLNNYVVQAEYFYECNPQYVKDTIQYAQVLLPDANGLLPHQENYDHEGFPQTLLKAVSFSQ
ncbi:DUF4262 domain-containing protein [Vibrio vulnificus]|uniref:DUF4262 domain-containing protein n=1 Tax=Vibrio vulnificus TaxID=672 RepID=A0AAW4H732_VIBVL|nr:DUF4262 domain-containing protein [Vibrio vulnificus]MBN8120531.1 DUF4262 domain-containing protein [Vibrio vulnificus]HAS6086786.1 DUF4262 domain-containing protein [Vibrio vulnificus]HDY7440443.1 DUF4262 domain-containing protein [Vibrio vulnificus]HDY7898763.1 DUF4262 domain-containing protein [Vibrio vulnificus]HDY7939033.1 DUF4262 domain-containing protein [Vibrio vulnificus]